VNLTKSALHDLVEDPAEREDAFPDLLSFDPDEPLCICMSPCDMDLCECQLILNRRHHIL